MRSPRALIVMLLAAALLAIAAACGSASQSSDPVGGAATAGQTADQAGGFRLARVASGLDDALYVTHAPGLRNRLFVVEQSGRIVILQNGRRLGGAFLDVSGLISRGGEQGLLGLAFHPGYARSGRFYVNYTDRDGDTQVVEYRRRSATRANPSSARRLLTIDQPYDNHNGGGLAFGPDGLLYIGTGDGGSGGDPEGNGQNVNTLLGKILRIDVNRRSGGLRYGIPASNPFARGGGRPEIYSYGLRNPWRFSFDRVRGDLWIADVGQNEIEEIDYAARGRARGANFGWSAFEGRSRFDGGSALRGAHTPPVAQYTHADGCSVTGGYVYRGARVPALRGRYVFGDYCSGKVWSMRAGPRPGAMRDDTSRLRVSLSQITSFGEGPDGDLYVIASGVLYRFVKA
ncbi:MAG: sorbosone dehydrogenase family protein [Thermoleophilia bacterium]